MGERTETEQAGARGAGLLLTVLNVASVAALVTWMVDAHNQGTPNSPPAGDRDVLALVFLASLLLYSAAPRWRAALDADLRRLRRRLDP